MVRITVGLIKCIYSSNSLASDSSNSSGMMGPPMTTVSRAVRPAASLADEVLARGKNRSI